MDEILFSIHCFKFNSYKASVKRMELITKIKSIQSKISKDGFFISKQFISIKRNADIIIWNMSDSYDKLRLFKEKLYESIRDELIETYSYLSIYEHANKSYLTDVGLDYIVLYPIKKDPQWYLLDKKEQDRITSQHVDMAVNDVNNGNIRSYTTYSFAIDDFEFLVIYEVESIINWMKVARNLRRAEARKWITVESPVFVGKKV